MNPISPNTDFVIGWLKIHYFTIIKSIKGYVEIQLTKVIVPATVYIFQNFLHFLYE